MKVELLKDHEHAGQPYKAGAPLDVDTGTAQWLIDQGIARAAAVHSPKPRKQQED